MKSSQSNFYFTESILELCDIGVRDSGEYLCTASVREATTNATNATVLTVLNEGIKLKIKNTTLCKGHVLCMNADIGSNGIDTGSYVAS